MFLFQAKALHQMCGAKVSLKVVAESGKYHSVDYPPITKRSVKLQIGELAFGVPKVTPKRKVAPKTHSPKKITSPIQKAIINLPGKKTNATNNSPSVTPKNMRVKNTCQICFVVFNGIKDKDFRKKYGLQGTWLGCEKDGCDFWAHARCVGVHIKTRKSIPGLTFFCSRHRTQ